MKKCIIIITLLIFSLLTSVLLFSCTSKKDNKITLTGGGASFPYPVYSTWIYKYSNNFVNHTLINYQSIGSGAGITQTTERLLDFGGSDEPLKLKELKERKIYQLPMLGGAVVLGFNIKGINSLKLNSKILSRIFLGEINNWNDPAIQEINSKNLPNLPIKVVHRADGSGTTWLFTNYLSIVSKKWKEEIGGDKVVNWPIGIGGKGNEGVATYIQQINGSIGYVEMAYAEENHIPIIILKNKDGFFVEPSVNTVKDALKNVEWDNSNGFYQTFLNLPGKNTWPIIGVSYILIPYSMDYYKKQALYEYLIWCYSEKASIIAENKGYVVPPTFDIIKYLQSLVFAIYL